MTDVVVTVRITVVMRNVDDARAVEIAKETGNSLVIALNLIEGFGPPDEVTDVLFVGYDPPRRLVR